MAIMAIDHTREFFHAGAMNFRAEDLARTTPLIFLSRWVTHICAPVFLFTAGMAARFRMERGDVRPAEMSRYLVTRGLWLIVVELIVMRLAMNFSLDLRYPVLLIILWALGWSMIALAALVHLPPPIVGALGLFVILGHNALDAVQAAQFGGLAWMWNLLHQPGVIVGGGVTAVTGYPVLPWMGVMAVGFASAGIYTWEPGRRLRALRLTGTLCIAGFVALRALNVYGDPAPWSTQPSALFTALSFLNTTKYPPSLQFLLMTLGPAAWLLAAFERASFGPRQAFVVFGRVPFAYYVVHFWILHVAAALAALARYGAPALEFLGEPFPSMGGPRNLFPPDFGFSLGQVYFVWLILVAGLYPCSRWLGDLKARRRDWWLSYL